MEYDRSEIKVGLVLVVGIVLLIAFFAIINRWTAGEEWRASARFAQVKGLKRGASVQYAGVRCGQVAELRYVTVPHPEGEKLVTRVELVLAIDADVPLSDKDVAFIDRSLTGEVVVEIEPGPGNHNEPGQDVILMAKEVPTFASLMETVKVRLDEISDFAQAQRPVVEEALDNFRDTFANGREAAGRLAELLADEGELEQVLSELREFAAAADDTLDENRQALNSAVENASDFFAQARKTIEELSPGLSTSAASLEDVTARVQEFLSEHGPELGDAADHLAQLSQRLDALVADGQPRVEATLEDLRQTAATVRVTVEDLRRNPWKLVLRPLGEDAYTQNLFDTARELVLTTAELARTAEHLDRLRTLDLSEADDARVAAALESVAARLARSAALQEELWEALKSGRR